MSNPIYALIGQNGNMMNKVREIAAAMKGNPQALLQSNPQVQQLIQQHGSAQNAFYALARQMGIDPNEVLKTLEM